MANLIQCLPPNAAVAFPSPPRYTASPTSRTENSPSSLPPEAFIRMSMARGRMLNDTLPSTVPCPGTLPESRYETELSLAPLSTAFCTAATGVALMLPDAAVWSPDAVQAAVPHSTAPVSSAPKTRDEIREK